MLKGFPFGRKGGPLSHSALFDFLTMGVSYFDKNFKRSYIIKHICKSVIDVLLQRRLGVPWGTGGRAPNQDSSQRADQAEGNVKNLVEGLPWQSSGYDSALPMQGARVPSLVRELDPHTCRNEKIPHTATKILRATTKKTPCAATKTRRSQINR